MMPSCDQIGVPIHFHSSTTSGSAALTSLRILPRVSPRQSRSSAILFEMSSDADWPWPAPDFFMFSSWKFHRRLVARPFHLRQGLHLTISSQPLRVGSSGLGIEAQPTEPLSNTSTNNIPGETRILSIHSWNSGPRPVGYWVSHSWPLNLVITSS